MAMHRIEKVANIAEARKADKSAVSFALLGLESGFETPDLAIIAEQDILGDRLIRRRKAKKASDVLVEASSLTPGDLMVHADHGIGRFIGLKTIAAAGAPHDCVELEYSGGDKLFLPIENMELLTRYGSDETSANLDKLGGASWQGRKARMKKRIREMAEELIKIAAARETRPAPVFTVPDGAYNEFVTRFPYEETDDQLASIDAVTEDLAKGKPMDRLICGDVGFGKTEVALRAAFLAVMEGKQVAVVVPTTLLGAAAFPDLHRALPRLPGEDRAGLAPRRRERAGAGARGAEKRPDRHRGRHARAARQDYRVQGSGPAHHRRGAAFRRGSQGTA